jgi:hypothetical protein
MPPESPELIQIQTLPNWSPVIDCQLVGSLMGKDDIEIVSKSVDPLAASFPSEDRQRMYVGSGHRNEGSLKELRTGFNTNVTVEFEHEQYHPILPS